MIITPNDVHRYHVSSRSDDYCHRDIYIFDPAMKNICDSLSPDLYNEIVSGEYPLIYSLSQNTIYSLEEMLTRSTVPPSPLLSILCTRQSYTIISAHICIINSLPCPIRNGFQIALLSAE